MNGIEKEVDSLGRVVLPISFRKKIGAEPNTIVLISLENDTIIISPANKYCALCGNIIESKQKFKLCEVCIEKIKES